MNPQLKAALDALHEHSNALPLLAIAFQAREAAEDGRYCECVYPQLQGADLLCGACLLNNKDQERSRVRAFAHAHDFVPGGAMDGAFCKACVRLERDPRHHGQNAKGVTSWGEEV